MMSWFLAPPKQSPLLRLPAPRSPTSCLLRDAPPTDPCDALPRPSEEALVHDLPSFHWDSREAVRYEVAIEAINRAIGAYTARPDTVLLARLRAEMIVCGQSAVASIRSWLPGRLRS